MLDDDNYDEDGGGGYPSELLAVGQYESNADKFSSIRARYFRKNMYIKIQYFI